MSEFYNVFANEMRIGDIVLSPYTSEDRSGSIEEIDGIGIITWPAEEPIHVDPQSVDTNFVDKYSIYSSSRSFYWVTKIYVRIL